MFFFWTSKKRNATWSHVCLFLTCAIFYANALCLACLTCTLAWLHGLENMSLSRSGQYSSFEQTALLTLALVSRRRENPFLLFLNKHCSIHAARVIFTGPPMSGFTCQVLSLTSIERTVLLQNGSAADSKHFLTASAECDRQRAHPITQQCYFQ